MTDILTLMQYLVILNQTAAHDLRPYHCVHCGKTKLWVHGHYDRKGVRGEVGSNKIPVAIYRYYCSSCNRTCSVLPECIPPRRWYLWSLQQAAMLLVFSGVSIKQCAKQSNCSRATIRCWATRFSEQFVIHTFQLKTKWPWLGLYQEFKIFWTELWKRISLAAAMYFLNLQNVTIP